MKNIDHDEIQRPLMDWYRGHHRDLPWRQDRDPYHIWVSEIMLQQTRVEAVKRYYDRFLTALPDIKSLAECPQDQLMKLWEGLGYYSRVRNMQAAAQTIMEDYGGRFPETYEEILALKGIGTYTAGAISSIAFGLKQPAVDGNVLRIYMRLTADPSDIAQPKVKKELEQELRDHMPEEPGLFNQAMMELGATVCLPGGTPLCRECPWESFCQAHREGRELDFPVKAKAKARRIEERTILIISDGQQVLIEKRPDSGLLAGLYQYPNLQGHLPEEQLIAYAEKLGQTALQIQRIEDAKHIFSHIEWHMQGYFIRIADCEKLRSDSAMIFADRSCLEDVYALPSAFKKYTEYAKKLVKKYE